MDGSNNLINDAKKQIENNPVNKKINYRKNGNSSKSLIDGTIDRYNKNFTKETKSTADSGVSVITCTHMYCYMNNIIENFLRQKHPKKELIIVLNSNNLHLEEWKKRVRNNKNIKVFHLDEKTAVGSCMNFAVEQSKYDYVANFDHDDYYGKYYLNDFMKIVGKIDADLFGKKEQFVYFEKSGVLAIRNPNNENKYVDFLDGPTVFFRKSIFEKVKYIDSDRADKQLSYDCNKVGIKIYSINKENFCYMRKSSKEMHTWKIEDDDFLALPFLVLGKTKNFKKYVNTKP